MSHLGQLRPIYDDGGPGVNYSNSTNYWYTIDNGSDGLVGVSFLELNMETNWDFLYLCNNLLEKSDTKLSFDVTRCKYAEMYRELGISNLGAVLSCNRDASLIEGCNPTASLDRKETIMAGGKCCTFRYTFKK